MSYGREWDQGKGYHDNQSWGGQGGQVRQREDDEYGAGADKRRKYNDWNQGGYDAGNYGGHSGGHGYDESHDGGSNKFGAPRRRLVPSEPSQHVIFLGLDPDFNEADLQNYLLNLGGVLDSVTIIRDRTTGLSKGFGFAQFSSTELASAFVTPRFPFIHLPPPASHGASAMTAWQAAMKAGNPPQSSRRVKIDFSQSVNPPGRGGPFGPGKMQAVNDGTRDIGATQAPALLFRGLDTISSPDAISHALKSSEGPGKEGAKGMKRILLIKDKSTKISLGFAFVEFVDNASASATLAATMSPQLHPSGFKISDRPVAVSFAHPYSFQQVPAHVLKDEACIPSSLALGGVVGDWARYWDDNSTLGIMNFEVEQVAQPQVAPPKKEKKKKEAPKDIDAEVAAFLGNIAEEAAAAAMPDKPVTISLGKAGPSAPKMVESVLAPAVVSSMFDADDDLAAPGEGEHEGFHDDTNPKAKRVLPLIASKKVVNNINKWNTVQSELSHNGKPQTAAAAVPASVTPAPVAAIVPRPAPVVTAAPQQLTPVDATPADPEEFGDPKSLACLLCSRAFKSTEQLQRHNAESDLHKRNLKDSNLCEVARQKVKTARAKEATDQAPKYRDRALERRAMHNQPDVPPPELKLASANTKKRADGPPPPPAPPPPPVNPGEDDTNVGNKLLKKMGWAQGTGLGTDGEGRVDPVEAAMYAQGAGLGASKGKDATKSYSSGYAGFVEKVKDSARERYNA